MMQKTRIATTTKSPLSKLAITLSYKYKYDTKTNSNEIVTTIKNLRSKLAITPSFIAVQNCHTNKNQSRLCVCDWNLIKISHNSQHLCSFVCDKSFTFSMFGNNIWFCFQTIQSSPRYWPCWSWRQPVCTLSEKLSLVDAHIRLAKHCDLDIDWRNILQ